MAARHAIDFGMWKDTGAIWYRVHCASCGDAILWSKAPKSCPVGVPVCSPACAKELARCFLCGADTAVKASASAAGVRAKKPGELCPECERLGMRFGGDAKRPPKGGGVR